MTRTDEGFIPLKVTPNAGIYLALCIIGREHGQRGEDLRVATQHLLLGINRLRVLLGQNGIADGYPAGALTPTFEA